MKSNGTESLSATLPLLFLLAAAAAGAQGETGSSARSSLIDPLAAQAERSPTIHPGSIELGVAGSFAAIEGTTRADLAVRGATSTRAGAGLLGVEVEASYGHVASLDRIGAESVVFWQAAAGRSPLYLFVGVGGGVRTEKIGSFDQTRYPVGYGAGLKALAGSRVALRAEYRYRRILRDPVEDYAEHQVLVGLSLFLRNSLKRGSGF